MDKIKKLPSKLINKIAAGEVVERPASVLKELLENSVDAGATSIIIKVENGGLNLIEVSDNGKGIPESEIELAFTEHATSKLQSEEDLENILTFGFRGEALASISAAAEISAHSSNETSKPIFVSFSNTELTKKENKPRNIGTTISVSDLFRHIPARKKFLSSENTEFKHLFNVFINVAIANPQIEFKFFKDNKEYKHLLYKSNIQDRIGDIMNIDPNKDLIKIFNDSANIKISGFIGHPRQASDKSPKQYIFLNNRPIQDKVVYSAIKEGFGNNIPRDRKPSYFIFLQINPREVDVNVHPRKSEVKFSDPQNLFRTVKHTVSKSLEKSLSEEFKSNFPTPDIESETFLTNTPRQIPTKTQNLSSNNQNYRLHNHKRAERSDKSDVSQGILFTQSILTPKDISPTSAPPNIGETNLYSYVGQIFNTFLLFTREEKFLIIDQHAADERVKFEQVEQSYKEGKIMNTQPLLLPYRFELSGTTRESLISNLSELEKLGIEISELGGDSFQLTSIPSIMENKSFDELIDAIASDLEDDWKSSTKIEQIRTKLTSTIACHSSIRAGDSIDRTKAIKIIHDLFKCKSPFSCPHGRPIVWEITKKELFNKFERP